MKVDREKKKSKNFWVDLVSWSRYCMWAFLSFLFCFVCWLVGMVARVISDRLGHALDLAPALTGLFPGPVGGRLGAGRGAG